jgi:hypothetical protein
MGFASLQRLRNRRSASHGLCLPATFRLQGLATLLTAYSLRYRAGFLSHRQRSWDSPFGAFSSRKVSRPFPTGRTHLPFRLPVYPHTQGAGAGSTSRGSWALTLPRVPGDRHVFSTPTAGCSRGLPPSRAAGRSLGRDFARPPLTRLLDWAHASPPAPQSFDRLPLHLIRPPPVTRIRGG